MPYKLVSEAEYRRLHPSYGPDTITLIHIGREMLGLEPIADIETPEVQAQALAMLLGELRKRLTAIESEVERQGYGEAIVRFQERLLAIQAPQSEASDGKPDWVSQAFWDATDPRLGGFYIPPSRPQDDGSDPGVPF